MDMRKKKIDDYNTAYANATSNAERRQIKSAIRDERWGMTKEYVKEKSSHIQYRRASPVMKKGEKPPKTFGFKAQTEIKKLKGGARGLTGSAFFRN